MSASSTWASPGLTSRSDDSDRRHAMRRVSRQVTSARSDTFRAEAESVVGGRCGQPTRANANRRRAAAGRPVFRIVRWRSWRLRAATPARSSATASPTVARVSRSKRIAHSAPRSMKIRWPVSTYSAWLPERITVVVHGSSDRRRAIRSSPGANVRDGEQHGLLARQRRREEVILLATSRVRTSSAPRSHRRRPEHGECRSTGRSSQTGSSHLPPN